VRLAGILALVVRRPGCPPRVGGANIADAYSSVLGGDENTAPNQSTVTARGVSCTTADRFIVAISEHRERLKIQNTPYAGYFCRPRPEGVAVRIRCTQGQRVIAWFAGT
jgi:hypothetical protein